jgi:hypothetical protein
MRTRWALAVFVTAVAMLAVPQGASAGLSPGLATLSQANGVLGAEWFSQPGTSTWRIERSPNTTDSDGNGFWDDGTLYSVPPDSSSYLFPNLPGGQHWVRVIATATLDACNANPADPQCELQYSNEQSIVLLPRVNGLPALTAVSQSGGVISAKWTVPSGGSSLELHVATSPARFVDGFFMDEVRYALLDPGATSGTLPATAPLPLGTYYVQVMTTQSYDACANAPGSPECALDFSPVVPITVTPPGAPAPAPGGAGPASGAAAGDKVVALGTISAASRQDVDKLGITLNPGEAVKAKLSGSVSVPGASKVYRFKTVSKSLGAGKKTKLSLKLGSKAKKAVKRALRRKKKLKAKLTLVVTDSAGNAQTKKYSVRLKR